MHRFKGQRGNGTKATREAAVAPASNLMESIEYFPMGNLHEELGHPTEIRGNYEKQVKVRGHLRPLTHHTGQQS